MHRPPLWAKMLLRILLPPARNEPQQSINNSWSCILANLRAMERRHLIIDISTAFLGKYASDYIVSASYNWVPTERQQFFWGLNKLYSNELHCIVTELSLPRSVISICPCIQLHQYACNVSQIWLFLLVFQESIYKNPHSTLQSPNLWQCHESDYPAIKYLPWHWIEDL